MPFFTACDSEHVAKNAVRSSARSILVMQVTSAEVERADGRHSGTAGSLEVSCHCVQAAFGKVHSRVRHFGGVFALPYKNTWASCCITVLYLTQQLARTAVIGHH